MSLWYTCIDWSQMMRINKKNRLLLSACILILLGISSGVNAEKFNLKKLLLMPGDLISGHMDLEDNCENCHVEFDQSNQNPLCLDCHKEVAADLKQGDGFHAINTKIKGAHCRSCHTDHKGRAADIVHLDKESFNHELTNYPLEGAHSSLSCSQCHESGKGYRKKSYQCNDCHKEVDPHKGKLGQECDSCHSSQSWAETVFNHDETKFKLLHKHKKVPCESCHLNNLYENTPQQCADCHGNQDIHQNRFGRQCENCHSSKDWDVSHFNHNEKSDFKLNFKHRNVDCNLCHKQSVKVKIKPENCHSCHKKDDIHNGRNGSKCESCHNEKGWAKTSFDHDKETEFSLKGKHKKVKCDSCHLAESVDNLQVRVCSDCHQQDDPHAKSLGSNCGRCHNENNWAQSTVFSHETTAFPLLGMHKQLSCGECHLTEDFQHADTDCYSCHQRQDPHEEKLGKDCGSCHNPNDWSYWLFDHNKQTKFSLEGAHQNLSCQLCHHDDLADPKYPPLKCGSCHRDEDIHRGSFGRDCSRCHNNDSFGSSN